MTRERRLQQRSVEAGGDHRSKFTLKNATLALLLQVGVLSAMQQSTAEPLTPGTQKKNRSNFEYHDGSAEEKRPYRRPELDTDPTNLRIEELRARINTLEERLEQLEHQPLGRERGR